MAAPDTLNRIHLFRDLPDELLQTLVGASERMLFQAGETIFKQGDTAEWLYIVEEGSVDIVIPSEGEEIVLASFARFGLSTGCPQRDGARDGRREARRRPGGGRIEPD
jgi:CRP-like cAMP-binding protein